MFLHMRKGFALLCFALRLPLVLLTAADKKFRYPTIDNPKISINRELRGSLYFIIPSTGSNEHRILYFGHQLLCLLAFLHHTYTKVGKQWREKECDKENGTGLSCDKFNVLVCPRRCDVHLQIRYNILTSGNLRQPFVPRDAVYPNFYRIKMQMRMVHLQNDDRANPALVPLYHNISHICKRQLRNR